MLKNKNRSISITMHSTQVQKEQRPQHKASHTELIEEKVRGTLEGIGTGDHSLKKPSSTDTERNN